jgi:predicted RNase H-like HicB family nuclease
MKTTHSYRNFIFTIEYEPVDPAYTVDVLDFPHIVTSGATLDEAFHNACEAIDLHLESMQKLGKPIPEPTCHLEVVNA